jgi:hypothetical protein
MLTSGSIICGSHSVDWDTLQIIHDATNPVARWDQGQFLTMLIQARKEFQASEPQKLVTMMWRSLACEATNPQDRVYGVLSLVHEPPPGDLVIDYDVDPDTMFEQVTRLYLEPTGDLRDLFVGYRDPACPEIVSGQRASCARRAAGSGSATPARSTCGPSSC